MRKDIYWQKALGKTFSSDMFLWNFFLYDFAQILCINLLPSFTLQSINTIHHRHISTASQEFFFPSKPKEKKFVFFLDIIGCGYKDEELRKFKNSLH